MKKQQDGLEDEALDFLLDLEEQDELDTFVFLELFTEEYRTEFEQWKKENSGKAKAYVNRFLLGSGEARRRSVARTASLQGEEPAEDLFSDAYEKAQSGAHEEAIELYRKVLEKTPKRPEALQNLTLLLLKTGDKTSARQTLEQWMNAMPEGGQLAVCHFGSVRTAGGKDRAGAGVPKKGDRDGA